MYKYISSMMIAALLLFGCGDLERDNLLDPKNEDSYSEVPILIEAFVNSELSYNEAALDALDDIEDTYKNEVLILEYHREILVNDSVYDDEYSNSLFTGLHQYYADNYNNYPMAIPDIYLNGSKGRILGASSSASVVDRIEDLLPGLLNEKSDYNMEAEMSASGSKLNINYKVARLGNRSSSGLQLQVALVKNFGMSHANRVVQFVNYPVFETISRTNAGEYAEGNLSFDLSDIDNLPDTAIFKIVQENSIKVLFTMKKEIEW